MKFCLLAFLFLAQSEPVLERLPLEVFAAKLKAEPGTILDVRKPDEFQAGHVAGAENLNFYDENFAEHLKAKPKDQTYYIYCHSGGRSGKTLTMMKDAGFQKVYEMEGGMSAWKAAAMPVSQ